MTADAKTRTARGRSGRNASVSWPLAALAVIAGVLAAFACGGDGDASVGDGDASVGADDALVADTAPSDDDTHDPLANVDAGCPLKVDGPRTGAAAASVPRVGATGVAWSDPGNARAVDGLFARALLDVTQASELLRVTDFGFQLPASATIKGVEVELKRQAADAGIVDGNIELFLDGAPSDRPKFLATTWPRLVVGTHHYGQAIDTWGNDLTPELVGRRGFGVEIFAQRQEDAGSGAILASIESMRVTVFYCD